MAASDIFREVCAWTSLRDAIRAWYGVESEHVGCEHVVERCDDSVLWEGTVEVFRVLDDPRASFVYTWSDDASDGPSNVAVLGEPPISGARDAVHAAMATPPRPDSRDEHAGAARLTRALKFAQCSPTVRRC